MSDHTRKENIDFAEFLEQKEMRQIKFFRNCINKTNQFSAQFILEKFLIEHRNHLKELKKEIQVVATAEIRRGLNLLDENERFISQLCHEHDLSTLTLGESVHIAIKMEEWDLNFYKDLLNHSDQRNLRAALKRIISRKIHFIKRLKQEKIKILKKI